ncbi:diadenylate cyclase CdaA [Christensenella intestinihominis]|uniref:diadenylate cyclase CdaA n=1 Tax=Christensenella intestinihominis TaxID=1851429 RepID=UPI0009F6257C|nr:diadenylate cyclase CdaA [Christensenella intestinihominis]
MTDFWEPLKNSLMAFNWMDVIDIIVVALILYWLIKLLAKTRAIRVLIGLGVILILARIFVAMGLQTATWLMNAVIPAGAIVIVILFQPEIRRALEALGRGKIFSFATKSQIEVQNAEHIIEEISRAVLNMSKQKVGAILVFERKTGLADVLDSGTMLDAEISSELIENIFYPNTPLHDGAMILRDDRIVAAGCFLPLSDNKQVAQELGTRHRASLGVSEVSDAYIIVVSEEKGIISFAYDGVLKRFIDAKALKEILEELYMPQMGNKEQGKLASFKFKRKVGDDK